MTVPASAYQSCFISYARSDDPFVQKLHDDLEANGVECWLDIHDMQGGRYARAQITRAVQKHDRLVLVCSERSLLRPWVVGEVLDAIERERETGSQKLFPIRIDDFILGQQILDLVDAKLDAGEWREDWVRLVRAYHIPDFSQWQDPAAYQAAFQKLLRDLQHPEKR